MKKGNGVTRAYADSIIKSVPEIAIRINSTESQVHTIKKIAVFGSYYTTEKDLLGDLDLAVEIENRDDFIDKLHKLMENYSGSYLNRMFKASDSVNKELVSGKKCIHLTTFDDLMSMQLTEGKDYKIIFNIQP